MISSYRSQNVSFSFDCKVGGTRRLEGESPGRRDCAKEMDQRECDMGRKFSHIVSSYHSPKENLVIVQTPKAKEGDETARQDKAKNLEPTQRTVKEEGGAYFGIVLAVRFRDAAGYFKSLWGYSCILGIPFLLLLWPICSF